MDALQSLNLMGFHIGYGTISVVATIKKDKVDYLSFNSERGVRVSDLELI